MTNNYRIICCMVILFLPVLGSGCERKGRVETCKAQIKGIAADVEGGVSGKDKAGGLRNVFDGDPKTGCLLQKEYGDFIRITLSKPQYISGLVLVADLSTIKDNSRKQDLGKHIRVFAYSDPDEIFPAGSAKYALRDTKDRQTIILENAFLKLMRVRTVAVEMEEKEGKGAALWLNEIEPQFASGPSFVPTMKLNEIAAKYAKENADWSFNNKDMKETIEEEVLANLIFYALNGSKQAEKMFQHFSPPSADSGEWASFLQAWYEQEKGMRK